MRVHRKAALIIWVLAALGSAAVTEASHTVAGVVVISGHVLNPYGDPVFACVQARHEAADVHSLARAVTAASNVDDEYVEPRASADGYVLTNADGSYTLAVPPGTYHLRSAQASSSSRSCNAGGTFPWVTKTINTVTAGGPTDFVIPYNVHAQIGTGNFTAFRQGASVTVLASVTKDVGDASATWTDHASGTVVQLSRSEVSGISGVTWRFSGNFTIPQDRLDGEYGSTFDITVEGVPNAAEVVSESYFVDSQPPAITATYPADGATNIRPTLSPSFWGADATSGVACELSRDVKVYRITASGDEVVGRVWHGQQSGFQGRCSSGDGYNLIEGSWYRAEFNAQDQAGNSIDRSAVFRVGDGPLFYDASPTGSVPGPLSRIEVKGDTGIDPRWVRFKVSQLIADRAVTTRTYNLLKFDAETRRFWIDLDTVSSEDSTRTILHKPPLGPGRYRITIDEQTDLSGNPLAPFAWEFEVTP